MPTIECKGMMEVENLHVCNFTITRVITGSPGAIKWMSNLLGKRLCEKKYLHGHKISP